MKEGFWNAGLKYRTHAHLHRHHLGAGGNIEQFLTVAPPARRNATASGNGRLTAQGGGEWLHIDLIVQPAGGIGCVSDHTAVGRKPGLTLIELGREGWFRVLGARWGR